MTDVPETIWARAYSGVRDSGFWVSNDGHELPTQQYRHADLPPTLESALALPEIAALVEAAQRAARHYAIVHKVPVGMRTAGMTLMDKLTAALAAIKPES